MLLCDGFKMDAVEDIRDEIFPEAELFAALNGRREDFLPAGRLQDGDAVVSLQVAYFTRDAHAVGKRRQEGDVQLVDGEPQFVQFQLAFRIFGRPVAQHKLLHEHAKLFGRELLLAVRKSGRRIDVGFDHKPLEIKIESLLGDFLHQRGVACDMGRIAKAWQARQTALQLDREIPCGRVAVFARRDAAAAAQDGGDAFHARLGDPLDGADPQLQIRIDGILHEHRDVHAVDGVRDLLHGERRDGRPRADPYCINSMGQSKFDMLRVGDLHGERDARLRLRAVQPVERLFACAFEGARPRARFPHARPQEGDLFLWQGASRRQNLLFRFGGAWSGQQHALSGRQLDAPLGDVHEVVWHVLPRAGKIYLEIIIYYYNLNRKPNSHN